MYNHYPKKIILLLLVLQAAFAANTFAKAGAGKSSFKNVFAVSPPAVTSASRCGAGPVSMTASGGGTPTGGTYNWYLAPTGGTSVFTGATYSPSIVVTTTNYYVSYTAGGTESSRTTTTATIYPIPGPSIGGSILGYAFTGNANDASGKGNTGTLQGSPTITTDRYGIANSAYSFNGSSDFVTSATQFINPTVFTLSIWFNTTTTTGGKLIGFGDSQTGTSGNYDRHIYMNNAGQLYFGLYNGFVATINTTNSYNDGNWHHVTVTVGSDGSTMYVDGFVQASNASMNTPQVFNGYWRIAYDNMNGWTSQPSDSYFTGKLDDITVYNRELTAAEINTSHDQIFYTINPNPASAGSALTLAAIENIPGATFTWKDANNNTQTGQSVTFSSAVAGNYSLTVTGGPGGCTTTATIKPSFTGAAPTVSNTSRCGAGSVTLTASGAPNGSTYNWYTVASGGTPVYSSTSNTYSPYAAATGSYYVSYTSGGIESARSAVVTVTVNPIVASPISGLSFAYPFTGNANDVSGNGNTGTLQGSPTITTDRYGIANSAYSFNGSSDYISTTTPYVNPTVFTLSVWFNTTTTTGGRLIGFGGNQTGQSSNYDRHIYMTNAGQLYYGIYNNAVLTINTTNSYNDGNWHHVTVTTGPDGSTMYVDGVVQASNSGMTTPQVFNGYWRIAYDNLTSWTASPTSFYFNGKLDDIAVYSRELTAAEIGASNDQIFYTTSPNPVNAGSPITLAAAENITGATYTWKDPNNNMLTGQSVTFPNAIPGNYVVTATGGPGGCSSTATVTPNITPQPPTITSFTPSQGASGTTITITGTNFTGTTAVTIGGVAVTSYTIVSATSITAVVGAGNTGTISITNATGTGTSTGSFTLAYPLDKVGTPNASTTALSIRQLSTTYTHTAITPPAAVSGFTNSTKPLMRIRRTSDNGQLDIGYLTNGDLDTATIKCFTGSNSAYVSIWYDQSGNSRDVSQATAANQPRIVNAGTIERSNGFPAVRFMAANNTVLQSAVNASTMFTSGYIGTASAVMEASANNSGAFGYGDGTAANRWLVHANSGGGHDLIFDVPNSTNALNRTLYNNAVNEGPLAVYDFVSSNTTQTIYLNNNSLVSNTFASTSYSQTPFSVGGLPGLGNYYHNAHQSELIFYNTALSTADLTTVFNNQAKYFTPVTYYSKASGDLTQPANWGTATDGTGTAPADFLGSGQNATYKLANRASYTLVNDWTVNANLYIPAGSALDLAGKNLTIAALTGPGTLTGNNASTLTLTGTTGNIGFTTGAQTIKNLTVNACASGTFTTTANILDAGGVVTLNTNSTLNTGGFLNLKSSINGTARVAPVGTNVTVTGNIVAERYTSDERSWRLLAPAVASSQTIQAAWMEGAATTSSNPVFGYGTFITGGATTSGFDHNYADNPSIYLYNNAALTKLANLNATTLGSNSVYFLFIRGSRAVDINNYQSHGATVLRSTGTLRTGDYTTPVAASGYTVVANPYPSPVTFAAMGLTNVPQTFYVYDYKLGGPTSNGGAIGAFVTYSYNGSSYTVSPSSSTHGSTIQSGEGFVVASTGTAGSIVIHESSKDISGTVLTPFSSTRESIAQAQNTGASPISELGINLLADASILDGVVAGFGAYSNKVDYMDAGKVTNFNENIALKRDTSKLSIERRATINKTDTLYIQLWNMQQQKYNLQIDPSSFKAAGLRAYLVDAYLKTRTLLDLGQTSSLPFTVTADAASYNNRFSVAFDQPDIQVVFTTVTAVNQNGIGKVSFGVTGEYFVKQYDVEKQANGVFGSIATITQSGLGGYSTYDNKLQAGLNYYRVKATDIYGNVTYSQTVSLNGDAAAQSVKVYPNPAVGKHIVLNFSNMPKGDYSLTLISPMGQQLKSETVSYDGSALSAALDAYGPAGVYLVNIKSATYNHTEKVFVN